MAGLASFAGGLAWNEYRRRRNVGPGKKQSRVAEPRARERPR